MIAWNIQIKINRGYKLLILNSYQNLRNKGKACHDTITLFYKWSYPAVMYEPKPNNYCIMPLAFVKRILTGLRIILQWHKINSFLHINIVCIEKTFFLCQINFSSTHRNVWKGSLAISWIHKYYGNRYWNYSI